MTAEYPSTRHFETFCSELFYSYSLDAGVTWEVPNIQVTPEFEPLLGMPSGQNKLGDYNDIESDNAGAHVVYAATFNGQQNIYYLRVEP